jgi:glutamate racemase
MAYRDFPIGIFDSGVGGISVLHEIHDLLPAENLIYVADSLHAPYGDKSSQHVCKRSSHLASFLLTHRIKALVVACNTATTEAISLLREELHIPVIGVEPAIKPAAKYSRNGIIGILATHRTLKSNRYQELVDLYASGKTILAQACPGLVEIVEAGKQNTQRTHELLEHYLHTILKQKADTLVLGCTHYPFLRKQIRAITGDNMLLLDTGVPVARQLQRILDQHDCKREKDKLAEVVFYSSHNDKQHLKAIQDLWGKTASIHLLPVEYQ